MKSLRASLIACAIATFAGTAMASSGSLVEFKPQVMPVVVQVDAEGKVTDTLPAEQLPPKVQLLLVKQLDAWITKPAEIKGHPVASRFIIEVAMHAKPRKDGMYDASFVYVKSLPMPFGGAVHWNVINGGLELALVSDTAGGNHVRFPDYIMSFPARTAGPSNTPIPATSQAVRSPSTPRAASQTPMPTIVTPAISRGNSGAGPTSAPHTERP